MDEREGQIRWGQDKWGRWVAQNNFEQGEEGLNTAGSNQIGRFERHPPPPKPDLRSRVYNG